MCSVAVILSISGLARRVYRVPVSGCNHGLVRKGTTPVERGQERRRGDSVLWCGAVRADDWHWGIGWWLVQCAVPPVLEN